MGAIGGLTGLAGGANGSGFAGPAGTNINAGVTNEQLQQSYTGNQAALNQQQALVQALQAQNGLGNQSAVYNQLQGVANGTGANPAAAQLAQATGANTANQAALMAGQRGAGQNVGLLARQASQQGAANQQAAAGQAATMQANQSLNALGQMGNLATTQAGQQIAGVQGLTSAQQNEQNILQGANSAANNANVAMQSNINNANAGLAGGEMTAQNNLISGVGNGLAGAVAPKANAYGGVIKGYADGTTYVSGNDATISSPSTAGAPNAVTFGANSGAYNVATPSTGITATSGPKSALGKSMSSPESAPQNGVFQAGQWVGSALGSGLKSLFGSGDANASNPSVSSSDAWASAMGAPGTTNANGQPNSQATYDMYQSMPNPPATPKMAKGGKVPAMVSPGERYLPPNEVEKVAKGQKDPEKAGVKIPGKAKVKGDSLKNDTVPATLEEGGIVLPKSVMESANPHWAAHKFVSAIMAKKGGMKRG
jgi:hypothetical protein